MSGKRVSEMTDDEIRALAGASDPVAAARACVERFCNPPSYAGGPPDVRAAKELMPRLLAALDAVLGLADELAATPKDFPRPPASYYAPRIREAITRELFGEEKTDG